MSKSPAFQFYPSDYLGSARVAEMTLEEEGAYLRALLYCWNHGYLPNDVERLARIIGKGCSTSVATAVQRMFNEDVNDRSRLVHPRLEQEREKQESHRSQRSAAGKKSAEMRTKSNERYNGRSTSVEDSLQRNVNLSSSSSSSEEIINPTTPTRAHVRAGEAFRPPVDEPSGPEPVAVPPAQLYDQAPKPPTLEQVIEYANMRGFAPDIAEWYYNLRAADAWTKESKQGNMRHILDWRHDFLLLAEKRRYELDQRKAGERTAERVTTTSRPFVIKGTGPAASDSSKAAS